MSNARKAALHLLGSDWSRGVWKHWLANIFQPPVEPPLPVDPRTAANGSAPAPAASSASAAGSDTAVTASGKLDSRCSSPSDAAPDSTRERELRRVELRARFDALSDRLSGVEDGLGTLLRRAALRDKAERRSDRQSAEMIDSVAYSGERQTAVLEGLLATVSRLEHAVARLEAGLSRVERQLGTGERKSHFPAASQPPARATTPPAHFESHLSPRERATRGHDFEELDAPEGGISGSLTEMSLPTVMAMLEIERHTGRLKVATDDGMLASFELTDGSVVSSRLSENDTDPLHTLRTALCWKQGRFWFRQQPSEAPSFPPRSIGSLLLEATRQNDESFANVG